MEKKINFVENLDTALNYLERFLKTETVVGEPMVIGDITLVPLVTVSFGAGGGGATGSEKVPESGAGGAGFGGKITTDAVLVIKNGEVTLVPVKGRNDIDRLVGMVPDLLGRFMPKKKDETEDSTTDTVTE